MKHYLALALLCAAITTTASCNMFGFRPEVDNLALFKPAQLTWPAVENDYLRGLDDGAHDGDLSALAADVLRSESARMESALATEDRDALRLVPWTVMEPWASRGISAKLGAAEIGPGVAVSLEEQLDNFTATIVQLQSEL